MTAATVYPQHFYSLSRSRTISTSFLVDMTVADAIVQAENSCYIRQGVSIPRLSPQRSAEVLRGFSIQLLQEGDGYIATSGLSNIYEFEPTKGDAVRGYLYSLVDELAWLEKNEENLSGDLCEELNKIRSYIRLSSK